MWLPRCLSCSGGFPSIVLVFYYLAAVCVNQRNDVALQVVQVGVGSTIEQNHRRLILCIVPSTSFKRMEAAVVGALLVMTEKYALVT